MNKLWLRQAKCFLCLVIFLGVFIPARLEARTEKPTVVAEEFFRLLQLKRYTEAAELLCAADHKAIKTVARKASLVKGAGKPEQEVPTAQSTLADLFFLMHETENPKMIAKGKDAETIMPKRIGFFVPGQHYIIGNYALVFTRETYEID
ncbi:hypothetical protein JW933_09975, partial [candidate division FCPU426 bacterium]|nr:hypothetical protein [candidate division FCPU426 bacterium]